MQRLPCRKRQITLRFFGEPSFLAEPIDWADLAGSAGYFDQAHFGHEFRAFTGLTPTRYVEVRLRFLREHPGHALDSWQKERPWAK
ncbi:MAG TPA: AraC family transcriptional regulator [Solirubrobacterales bacterium]|nr:AraC family transcriptional regulator [Solirubrobacterales bacterium]